MFTKILKIKKKIPSAADNSLSQPPAKGYLSRAIKGTKYMDFNNIH